MGRLHPLLPLALLLACCEQKSAPLEVRRLEPGGDLQTVALNQELTVYFSESIDPGCVDARSVRVVDDSGLVVDGQMRVGDRSISFIPRPPVEPGLRDGSFQPGTSYRLELAGMPSTHAITSRAGRPLARSLHWDFQVASEPDQLGLPTPFLPVGIGHEPLVVDFAVTGPPRIAADNPVLLLHFSLPLLPQSVTPDALEITRILPRNQYEELEPESVEVLPTQHPGTRAFGCSVAVRLPKRYGLVPSDTIYVVLAGEKERSGGFEPFRDYSDRAVVPPEPFRITVDPGARVRVMDLEDLRLADAEGADLGFEIVDGRIRVRGRREAGDGRHGVLRPTEDLTLSSGVEFTDASGARHVVGPELQLRGLDVPKGVRLTIDAPAGLVIRSLRDIRVDGTIEIAAVPRPGLGLLPTDDHVANDLIKGLGLSFVTAGRLDVAGEIRCTAEGEGPPFGVFATNGVHVSGEVAPGAVYAVPKDRPWTGFVEGAVRFHTELTPGLAPGTRAKAGASTAWLPLPPNPAGGIDVVVDGAEGAIRCAVQTAPPDAMFRDRPKTDDLRQPLPLPLRLPLEVGEGQFLRLLLEADVEDSLPSIQRFSVLPR